MYDENKHWKECTICGEKCDEISHSYIRTWALGYESCYYTNSYTDVCSCGYSRNGTKACVWNGSSYIGWSDRNHDKKCSVCNYCIRHQYNWNNKLYEYTGAEDCYTSSGVRLDCTHQGQCNKCKTMRYTNEHRINQTANNELKCIVCGGKYGEITNRVITTDNAQVSPTYTIETTINLMNGATYNSLAGVMGNTEAFDIKEQKLVNKISSTQFIISTRVRIKNTIKYPENCICCVYINLGGRTMYIWINDATILPDLVKPVITNITMENEKQELTEWSRTKPIIISGTENYCDIVTVKIEDEDGNIIFNGNGSIINNNFSVTCIPEIECDTNGKKFIATVTDSCRNSTTQEFKIAKLDNIPPKPVSGTEITGDWAKSKNFTFKATDGGIGNIQIAFNDIEELDEATLNEKNEYIREYKFTGDVYKQKKLSVLYKDGLGNMSIQKITIDKIDNTAPNITSGKFHNNILTLTSNDEHETLGEGSGVVKYRYLASEEKLENPEVTKSNSIEVKLNEEIKIKDIYKIKCIYVVAEDYVGNISEVYEFKAPELKLTATANLNTANGKGEIILDWSSYDTTDKYFVIYRKEENEAEWQKIVSLEEKLTGSTYKDKVANDKKSPTATNINIDGNKEQNNIIITLNSTDTGSKYTYYIESYDSKNPQLLMNISDKIMQ